MAKLKSETLAHRHDQHGVPLRSRVFGGIRSLNRLGSATAPLSNLPNRLGFVRALMERFLGITAKRPLPRYERRNLAVWFRKRRPAQGRSEVTLLADSFTTYTEPAIGRAAVELLELAGYRVRLAAEGCCGRSSLSKGLLDDARRKAAALVAQLADTTSPIVGCEPSCLLTLRDETLSLLPDDDRARQVAGRVRQVEELLAEAIDAGDLTLAEDSWVAGRRILFHGHCHQKADVGTAATVALLRRIPGAQVVELDAGCCGMAGSFGFEAEHYAVSMTIGEDRLFPAVRAEPANTVIAATGVSCRQQIAHGTERRAHHPIELVLAAVTKTP
jgi:Fe-S oxidoreductase